MYVTACGTPWHIRQPLHLSQSGPPCIQLLDGRVFFCVDFFNTVNLLLLWLSLALLELLKGQESEHKDNCLEAAAANTAYHTGSTTTQQTRGSAFLTLKLGALPI